MPCINTYQMNATKKSHEMWFTPHLERNQNIQAITTQMIYITTFSTFTTTFTEIRLRCHTYIYTNSNLVRFIKSFGLRLWHQIKGAILSAFVLLCWPFFAPFVRIINESLVIINMCLALISPASQNIFFPDRKPLITGWAVAFAFALWTGGQTDTHVNVIKIIEYFSLRNLILTKVLALIF